MTHLHGPWSIRVGLRQSAGPRADKTLTLTLQNETYTMEPRTAAALHMRLGQFLRHADPSGKVRKGARA